LRHAPGFVWLDGTESGLLFSRPVETLSTGGFAGLEQAVKGWRHVEKGAVLAGWLAYDLARELEEIGAPPALPFPELHFGLFGSALHYRSQRVPDPRPQPANRNAQGRERFEASVRRIVDRIYRGDLFQANLCRYLEAPLDPERIWPLYVAMRRASPAQFGAFLDAGAGRAVLSMSPELFLRVRGGMVESQPIKGTRPRHRDPAEDAAAGAELLASEKDRAELAMIVDVVRNDLGRVCETGSIEVTEHARLMTLPTVHQLCSTVRGRLHRDLGTVDLLRAAFPAASISGAPKIEAMRTIAREEGESRGPAMGAIGWIGLDDDLELSVAIRTAFAYDGRVRYYAGCGITAESDAAAEFDESAAKAEAFVRALADVP
jgi:para-aminobenzoate synthetase component I